MYLEMLEGGPDGFFRRFVPRGGLIEWDVGEIFCADFAAIFGVVAEVVEDTFWSTAQPIDRLHISYTFNNPRYLPMLINSQDAEPVFV